MGNSTYSSKKSFASDGSLKYARASTSATAINLARGVTADSMFKEREIHESMNPKNAKMREARDSATHPKTVPIILGLDETGSMLNIPIFLVKEGLPNIMGKIMELGTPDPALLFLGIGDHESDRAPLQVGQFESGDAELDNWLTHVWLEGNGGGNRGESYLLAWYFAAFHTVTDAWEKRKEKGFLFTIGDEPCLPRLPRKALVDKIMGDATIATEDYTDASLLQAAQEKWNVYHLHVVQGSHGIEPLAGWKARLGQNAIQVDNYQDIAKIISNIVIGEVKQSPVSGNEGQDITLL